MSLTTAAEYALMLTEDPKPQQPTGAADAGGSHLDRIRDKTDCRRRTDLTYLALT
jgi:hypothetical protein